MIKLKKNVVEAFLILIIFALGSLYAGFMTDLWTKIIDVLAYGFHELFWYIIGIGSVFYILYQIKQRKH